MVSESFLECAFLIPIRRDAELSDGNLHSRKAWGWMTDELFERFKGATRAPGLYEGFYEDPDTQERVSDKSRKYEVAVPKRLLNELRQLLEEACFVFEQKVIYLSIAGKVEFITRPKF